MASTALQLSPQPIPIGRHRRKVQELVHLITHYSPRFRRIALAHLGNVADAEDAVQDARIVSFEARGPIQGSSEDVHVAHFDRDQFCTYEVTSTFASNPGQLGRNISRAESFVWQISSRIPDRVLNTCIKTEKLQQHWLMQLPGYHLFCG